MKTGQTKWIRFFWIPLIFIKAVSASSLEVWLLCFPLLTIRKVNNKHLVNLLIIQKIYDHTITPLRNAVRNFVRNRKARKGKKAIFNKFKNGEKLKIALMVERPGMWCFDYLYNILKNDSRFEVLVVIMPEPFYGKLQMKKYLKETEEEMLQKGYTPLLGYDKDTNEIINFRSLVNPDIIFYTDFWKPHFYNEFYIDNFLDKITLLTEYGYSVMQDEKTCGFELNNLVDLYFRPTEIHKKMAQEIMENKGQNVIVTGSPKLDERFDENYKPQDVWKKQDKKKKRIIWAPHYTDVMPADMYANDAFWYIYDFMLDLAEKYKDSVQFVFRPHPVLYTKMIKKWGEYITKKYYKQWDTLENGQVFMGNFIDLFMTSDAMIMDSCSFRAEYTSFDKPLFYTITETSRLVINEFGEELHKNFYVPDGNLEKGIESFIQDVVINGNDYKALGRHKLVEQYFGKINGHTASENIYNEIIKFLEKGEIKK